MATGQRLKADPLLGVADIMKPLKELLKEKSTTDLNQIVMPKARNHSWKTAPDPEWLAQLEPLFARLLEPIPSCILPSKKLVTALQKIQSECFRLNFTRLPDDKFFDQMDLMIRIAASQLRELKQNAGVYRRCMRKASIDEKAKVDTLLDRVALPAPSDVQPNLKGEVVVPNPLAILDKQPSKDLGPQRPAQASPSIFKRILSKQPSLESSPIKMQKATKPSKSTSSCAKHECSPGLNADETDLLCNAMLQVVPVAKRRHKNRLGYVWALAFPSELQLNLKLVCCRKFEKKKSGNMSDASKSGACLALAFTNMLYLNLKLVCCRELQKKNSGNMSGASKSGACLGFAFSQCALTESEIGLLQGIQEEEVWEHEWRFKVRGFG